MFKKLASSDQVMKSFLLLQPANSHDQVRFSTCRKVGSKSFEIDSVVKPEDLARQIFASQIRQVASVKVRNGNDEPSLTDFLNEQSAINIFVEDILGMGGE